MAELDSPILPSKTQIPSPKAQKNTWLLSNFLHKAIVFFVLIALLPLFPSQAPDALNQTFLTRGWELLHLLFVGIAISYGLFSRRNADPDIEKEVPSKADSPQSYVSRILQVSSVFEDDEAARPAGSFDETKTQTWSSLYYRGDPVVVVADGAATRSDKSLSLPVRRLKSHGQDPEFLGCRNETIEYIELSNGLKDASEESVVLPSPIPWRSRSGRMEEAKEESAGTPHSLPPLAMDANIGVPLRTPSFRSPVTPSASAASSPKNLSRSSSPSMAVRTKAGEDIIGRKKSFYNSAPPPAPPPPPPPFAHGSLSLPERRDAKKSFKEELKDLSRGREGLPGRSVRTVRSKEAQGEFLDISSMADSDPLLVRTSSAKNNDFVEKVVVTSADSDSDEDSGTSDAEDVRSPGVDAGADEDEVDKKADEFIAKFREQIRLQRIESIKRSTGQRTVRSPK